MPASERIPATNSGRILLVDDDDSLLTLLSKRLAAAGFEVDTARSGKRAVVQIAARSPDLVITDLRMSGMDGMALFDVVHETYPSIPVMILTAHGTIPDAVEATRRGVAGYLTKPFDSRALIERIQHLLTTAGQASETARDVDDGWCAGIVTRGAEMRELLHRAKRAATSETSIIVQGESGTGKELLARAIHRASRRAGGAFVAVNCAAIPEQLLESELFGHARGAFTGATRSHTGLFLEADGGTLFLDEVGDMPLAFQAKLLRALQEGEIRPVGSTQAVAVDARIISATHRDLEGMVAAERFREDLYYRINVVTLEIPPLAKRRDDIALLARRFLAEVREPDRTEATDFAPEALQALITAPWPGNVRQLRNVVEQCAVLATTPMIPATAVRRALRSDTVDLLPFAQARERFESDYLVRLLQVTEGNVSQAARIAKRNRSEFYKLLRKHDLNPELFRSPDGNGDVD